MMSANVVSVLLKANKTIVSDVAVNDIFPQLLGSAFSLAHTVWRRIDIYTFIYSFQNFQHLGLISTYL